MVVIRRNAKDRNGMFGLSLDDESGGVARVQRINSETELRASLLRYGVTDTYAEDILSRLERKHQSVEITVCRRLEISQKDLGIANMALPAKPAEISQYGLLSMDILGIRE